MAIPSTMATSPSSSATSLRVRSKPWVLPVTSSSIASFSGHGAASWAAVSAIVDAEAPASAPQWRRAWLVSSLIVGFRGGAGLADRCRLIARSAR